MLHYFKGKTARVGEWATFCCLAHGNNYFLDKYAENFSRKHFMGLGYCWFIHRSFYMPLTQWPLWHLKNKFIWRLRQLFTTVILVEYIYAFRGSVLEHCRIIFFSQATVLAMVQNCQPIMHECLTKGHNLLTKKSVVWYVIVNSGDFTCQF